VAPVEILGLSLWTGHLIPLDYHPLMHKMRTQDQVRGKFSVSGKFNWDLDLLMFL
jgi:hypothetical protein